MVLDADTQAIAIGLRGRDVALLQSLIERYQYRLVRFLIYLLGRTEGIDDLVQETWLRILERGSSYDGQSRFEPWLFAIARNLALDSTRRKSTISIDSEDDREAQVVAKKAVSSGPSPFASAARSQDAERLAGSMQCLDPLYREALALRFLEDLSLQEISVIVGAPVSTVASRIYRSLATLREQLEEVNNAV